MLWPSPENPAYHLFKNGETMAGGMTPILPEMGAIKPLWAVYFNVDNVDATVARARGLGGRIAKSPEVVEDVGRYAFIADPTGAHFGILTPAS